MKFFSSIFIDFFPLQVLFHIILKSSQCPWISIMFPSIFYCFSIYSLFQIFLFLFFSKIFPPRFVLFSSSIFYYSIFFSCTVNLMRLFFSIWCTFPLFTYNVKTDFLDCFPLKLGKYFGWIFFFLYKI